MASARPSEFSVRRLVVAALLACLPLVAPAQAGAATPPPPEDIPAVGAYVELVPTAGGSRQAGRRQRGRGLPLPIRVSRTLDRAGGSDAPLLKRVATAPDLGAPTRRLPLREATLESGGDDTGMAASFESVGQTWRVGAIDDCSCFSQPWA